MRASHLPQTVNTSNTPVGWCDACWAASHATTHPDQERQHGTAHTVLLHDRPAWGPRLHHCLLVTWVQGAGFRVQGSGYKIDVPGTACSTRLPIIVVHARQQQGQLLGKDERGLHQRGRILALQAIPGQLVVADHDLGGVWPPRSPRILACRLFAWVQGSGFRGQGSGMM